jgi:hypothetical protein
MKTRTWTAWMLAAGLLLVLGAGSAAAAGRDGPRRDHGRGHWFERVCDVPITGIAGCSAEVVSDAGGTPLATPAPPPGAYGPAEFHTGYSLPAFSPSPQTIAIVDAYDDPNIESDLAAYDDAYGLPACTTANGCFRKVNQYGGTSYPRSNSGWALEIALDVETAHQICQNCTILLVEASSASLANLGAAENEAVALGANAISNSWGAGEYSSETQDEARYFQHPGVAITASSGDGGYGVEFPAASRYVTAVGGTTLNLGAGDSYAGETVWSGAGSGCSQYEPKPSWQHDTGCSRRTVADVAADADPNTGAAVYDSVPYSGQSGWFQVGGTSLASPLIAAVYALTGAAGAGTYGSTPYANASLLHDVVSGSNGSCGGSYLCTAAPGYDGPTGLGTPNGTGAFSVAPPAPDFSLAATPSSESVPRGTSATWTVTVSPSGGFADPVDLSVSGLPAGATGSFSPPSLGSGSSTLTVTTASVAAGTYPLTITGTDEGDSALVHSVPVSLTVSAPDFGLSVSPSSRTATAGGGTTYTVTVSPSGGFAALVSLSASGLPSGATATFSPASLSSGSSTLTVTTSSSTPTGTYGLTITGSGGGLTRTTSATLTVQPVPAGDFSISVSPSRRTLRSTGSTTYTVRITPLNGFSGSVTLSVSGLPSGVTAVFSPASTTSTSTLTVTSSHAHSANATLTVTGTSGGLTHSATVSLRVR